MMTDVERDTTMRYLQTLSPRRIKGLIEAAQRFGDRDTLEIARLAVSLAENGEALGLLKVVLAAVEADPLWARP